VESLKLEAEIDATYQLADDNAQAKSGCFGCPCLPHHHRAALGQ
jgi:hypothetical protein